MSNKWIKTEEELPRPGLIVVVKTINDQILVGICGLYIDSDREKWSIASPKYFHGLDSSSYNLNYVTHWHYLPIFNSCEKKEYDNKKINRYEIMDI